MRRYRRSFFYFFPIGLRLAVFVATDFSYATGVTSYTERHAAMKRSSRCWRNHPPRIALQRTCELRIWGGKSSQSQRISFNNGRRPSTCGPIRRRPLNTTWHNLLRAALSTSKVFFLWRGGDSGRSCEKDWWVCWPMNVRNPSASSKWSSCHRAPLVMQHCCYVSHKSCSYSALELIPLISVKLQRNCD